jgi:hypothetical protein
LKLPNKGKLLPFVEKDGLKGITLLFKNGRLN